MRPVVGKTVRCWIEAAYTALLSHPYVAASISIDTENVIGNQAVGIIRVVLVMFELPTAFIEPIKTAIPAAQPDITACVFVNAIKVTTFAQGVVVFRAGIVMGDLSRPSIQSIQGAREKAYP